MYQDFMPPKRSWVARTAGGQWLGARRLVKAFRGNRKQAPRRGRVTAARLEAAFGSAYNPTLE